MTQARQIDASRLSRLLNARSVGFVGGRTMAAAALRCRQFGFQGPIYLIGPQPADPPPAQAKIACFHRLDQLPISPDAVFVGVNRDATLEIVTQANQAGVGGVICYASGFAESGTVGEQRQADLLRAAEGMPLIGPNAYGMINTTLRFALWPVAQGCTPVEQGVAIITQSGNLGYNVSMHGTGLPVSHIISVGNQAQLGAADLIPALLACSNVNAVGLHLETLGSPQRLEAALEQARAADVPVILLKSGVSQRAAELALGHTRSLVGSDAFVQAFCERLGVIRAPDAMVWLDLLRLASQNRNRRVIGGPIVGITCSGGDASLLADAAEQAGIELPELTDHAKRELAAVLPDYAQVSNPLDFTTALWADGVALRRLFSTLLQAHPDSALALICDYPAASSSERPGFNVVLDAFDESLRQQQRCGWVSPVFPALSPPPRTADGAARLSSLSSAAKAWSLFKQNVLAGSREGPVAPLWPSPAAPGPKTAQAWDEWRARSWLERHGLPVGPALLIEYESLALSLRAGLHPEGLPPFPVALKVSHPEILHKTDVGGVILPIYDTGQLLAALETLASNLRHHRPDLAVSHVLVEALAPPSLGELLVSVRKYPEQGWLLTLASGGITTEVLQDRVCLALPCTRHDLSAGLKRLRQARIWEGLRNRPAADFDGVLDALGRLLKLIEQNLDRLCEVEINPLLLHTRGCTIVDALISWE